MKLKEAAADELLISFGGSPFYFSVFRMDLGMIQ